MFGASADPPARGFTPQLRTALRFANEEAVRLRERTVDTEHQLLGLLRVGDPEISELLEALGATPDELRRSVEALVGPGRTDAAPVNVGELKYHSRVKRVLEHMAEEARRMGQLWIGPPHLLLAVLGERRGIAAEVFARRGITLEAARRAAAASAGEVRLRIDEGDARPIYEQIVAQVQEGIATGELRPGDRLPPVRRLAERLGIAPGTVARAYGELERLGSVTPRGMRGTLVSEPREAAGGPRVNLDTLTDMLRPVAVAAFHLGTSAEDLRQALEEAMAGIFPGPEHRSS